MAISQRLMEKLIFMEFFPTTRFTQDSPVYPDVWIEYFKEVDDPDNDTVDLIITAHRKISAGELFKLLSDRLSAAKKNKKDWSWELAATGNSIVAKLTLTELITVVLPLTTWWQQFLWHHEKPTPHQLWLKQLVGALLYYYGKKKGTITDEKKLLGKFIESFDKKYKIPKKMDMQPAAIYSISKNRPVTISIEKSVPATKGDAGRRVFDIDGSEIAWAVMDTGIDANHPAFRKKDSNGEPFPKPMGPASDMFSNNTRIVATYDFTRFRDILSKIHVGNKKRSNIKTSSNNHDQALPTVEVNNFMNEIEKDLRGGRLLDWDIIAPLLRIPHNDKEYDPPVHPHGTHVAGILGAGLKGKLNGETLEGMCPGIELYDIRVMNDKGQGKEFNILAAIQFIRWMNNQKDGPVIHGVNMSFSMIHEVASFACGQTPVCDACERLVAEGVVVVAAAGNLGQAMFQSTTGALEQGFRMVNITDPGNAETVITVGATHRNRPHSYGVSYFSSKGPTGDGRVKPDLVAPGEKIVSTAIGETTERMDGTSMAAPHVSGAAALLLSKHRELIGRPRRVKEILCKTATDLGREKYFQGYGLVDVLRAIQSV